MNFDDFLALVACIIVVLLLLFVNFKIFISHKKVLNKIIFSIVTLLLVLPLWYVIQFAIIFALAGIIPQNKVVNCIYLNETRCKERPDCELYYPIGGLGQEVKPMCINKGPIPFEQTEGWNTNGELLGGAARRGSY